MAESNKWLLYGGIAVGAYWLLVRSGRTASEAYQAGQVADGGAHAGLTMGTGTPGLVDNPATFTSTSDLLGDLRGGLSEVPGTRRDTYLGGFTGGAPRAGAPSQLYPGSVGGPARQTRGVNGAGSPNTVVVPSHPAVGSPLYQARQAQQGGLAGSSGRLNIGAASLSVGSLRASPVQAPRVNIGARVTSGGSTVGGGRTSANGAYVSQGRLMPAFKAPARMS